MKKKRPSAPATMQPSALILIGFMGAGKTSVGRALADRLGWTFEDLDDRIERRERRSVPEIFRDSGESAFRRAEHAALKELLREFHLEAKRILALGGGAFVQEVNLLMIESAGIPTLFLDAGVDELWRRCQEQGENSGIKRPLLRDLESFHDLYHARRPHYLRASQRLETAGKTIELVAAEIVKCFALDKTQPVTKKRERIKLAARKTGPKKKKRGQKQ